MTGSYIHVWLFLFAVFAEGMLEVIETGLYSRVELTGKTLDQDTVVSVEWTNLNRSQLCLKYNNINSTKYYPDCSGKADFSLHNNTLILKNVTAQDEGVYMETIVRRNGTKTSQNFTLIIKHVANATEIVVPWNSNGESEQHINVTGENSTVGTSQTLSGQILLSSGFTVVGVFGLCVVSYGLYRYHHRQRAENGSATDEGDSDTALRIYQEIPGAEEVTPLPYVYTDFIKPKEPNQGSAAAQHFEDFGYSEVGPSIENQYCEEQSPCVLNDAGEE